MTLLEVCVALVILAAAMTALTQLLATSARQRRTTDQRLAALWEVANEAERVAVLPWEDLTPERLTTWQPSAELKAALPSAQCRIRCEPADESPTARRITLAIGWTNSAGEPVAPVELSLWRHAPEELP